MDSPKETEKCVVEKAPGVEQHCRYSLRDCPVTSKEDANLRGVEFQNL